MAFYIDYDFSLFYPGDVKRNSLGNYIIGGAKRNSVTRRELPFACEMDSTTGEVLQVFLDLSTGYTGNIQKVAVDDSDNVYFFGYYRSAIGVDMERPIWSFTSAGAVNSTFVDGGAGPISSANYYDVDYYDDTLYVAGGFTTYSGVTQPGLIALNLDGSIKPSFVQGSGFTSSYSDPNYGMRLYSVEVDTTNEKLYVGGYFDGYNGTPTNLMARLNLDGSIDTGFTSYFNFTGDTSEYIMCNVGDFNFLDNGQILVSSEESTNSPTTPLFYTYSGISVGSFFRVNSDGTLDSSYPYNQVTDDGYYSGKGTIAESIEGDNNLVYLGGRFDYYSGVTKNHVVTLNSDGTIYQPFDTGTGFNSGVDTIFLTNDGPFYSGYFTEYNGEEYYQKFILLDYSGNSITYTEEMVAPNNITLTPGANSIYVQWNLDYPDVSDDCYVYWRVSGGTWNYALMPTATTTSYTIPGLLSVTDYEVYVKIIVRKGRSRRYGGSHNITTQSSVLFTFKSIYIYGNNMWRFRWDC